MTLPIDFPISLAHILHYPLSHLLMKGALEITLQNQLLLFKGDLAGLLSCSFIQRMA